jgi:hypothetical protein
MKNIENKTKPKVSIIIPVYNGSNYVSLAIECAIRQDYENIEILVIDDGSKDKTEKICKKYKDKITYIKKENGGVASALNLGIEKMTGDYFSWLSHDDLYYPNKISTEIKYLMDNNLLNSKTILCSNFSAVDEFGNFMFNTSLNYRFINKDPVFPLLFGAINGLSLLIPKQAFKDAGGFDLNLRAVQDYQLWFDMYKKGYKFKLLPNILVTTRYHSKSVTSTSPKVVTEGNEFWHNLLTYFDNKFIINNFENEYNYWNINRNLHIADPYDKIKKLSEDNCKSVEDKEKKNIEKLKVSVIVNASNIDNLKRAIDSVKKQTFKNIEIIIVNNLNKNLSKEFKDIKVVKNINDAIKESTGDYISFLDDNSTYKEEKTEKQLTIMHCADSKFSFTSYNINNERDLIVPFQYWTIDELSRDIIYINLSTVMVNKKYLIDNKILFDNKNKNIQEFILYINLIKKNLPTALSEVLVETNNLEFKEDNFNEFVKYLIKNNKLNIEKNIKYDDFYNLVNVGVRTKELNRINHDLERYKYLISNEYRRVNRIRKVKNKILFKKELPTYTKSYEELSSGKISRVYRKVRDKAVKVLHK